MLKKIIIVLSLFFVLFLDNTVFSMQGVPVENVFVDIKKDYNYYNEMQVLYNRGIIEPESDHKWHPQKLLERDEFIGIAMETSCRRCIVPHEEAFLHKYDKKKPFFDVGLENTYYYCIAEAADLTFTVGYRRGDKCRDGTQRLKEIPFCTANNIKFEEALAVIMRMSGMVSHQYAEQIANNIQKGGDYPDLAKDVTAKLRDGSSYSFYAYFKKALDFKLTEYDSLGNKKEYTFFYITTYDKSGGKTIDNYMHIQRGKYLRPNSLVTKEQFLIMAYIALKANACPERIDDHFALKMIIYDKECNYNLQRKGKCNISDKHDELWTFDFRGVAETTCKEGIDDQKGYFWRFVNLDTGKTITREGIYIDNYKFLEPGKYKVFLRGTDNCNQTAEVWNTLEFPKKDKKDNLIVSLLANPIYGNAPLEVDFEGIAYGCTPPYKYFWNFKDGNKGRGKYIRNTYMEKGLYKPELTIFSSDGCSGTASALILVFPMKDEDPDHDKIKNTNDLCPLIPGIIENSGCPTFFPEIKKRKIPPCIEKIPYNGYLFGNVICDTCPCEYDVDFKANLRSCDTLIPAITSIDEKTIFARGKSYTLGDILEQ